MCDLFVLMVEVDDASVERRDAVFDVFFVFVLVF